MSEFINTIDVIGDDALIDSIIDKSIVEYKDNILISIGVHAFFGCTSLTTANFPLVTSIGGNAFNGCTSLAEVHFPLVSSISTGVFNGCTSLTTADFPLITSIGSSAFYGCASLTTADFTLVTSIGNNAFNGCSKLKALILRNTEEIATLSNTNALNLTSIASHTGYIYVPADLIDSYKAATNWSKVATQFRALEDYTIDGTTTGKLDPNKI